MPQPTLLQARSHRAKQAQIAAAAAGAVASKVATRRPWGEVLTLFAAYQMAAAQASAAAIEDWIGTPQSVDPQVFAGVSALGFAIAEPLVATIDHISPAPAEALPAAWWPDDLSTTTTIRRAVSQLVASEVQDAGRTSASVAMVTSPRVKGYVRVLEAPSCKRCVVLAGRKYRDLEAFDRHPGCDCQNVPADSLEAAIEEGLVVDPAEAVARGWVRDLSKADQRALDDGADLAQVVNATRGTSAPGITSTVTTTTFGRTVKATTAGTTVRSAWRRRNPSRLVRLRPEAIYRYAADSADAQRLLRLYGYIR